jgi:hypothetical protein
MYSTKCSLNIPLLQSSDHSGIYVLQGGWSSYIDKAEVLHVEQTSSHSAY